MEQFISVSGVKTRAITHGLGKQALTKESFGKKDIIIIIPGNPGLIGFYEVFMLKIFKTLMEKVNVLGISHAGHDVGEKNIYNAPRLRDRPELYTLHGQIQHKKDFLDEYIPHGSRICFIGHSIGSKVVVELMSHLDQTRPNDPKPCGYLLFPTIERMAETPQGQRLRMLLGPFRTPAVYASYMVYFLPEFVKNALVSWYISQPEKEDLISSVGQALKTVVNPNVLEKSLYMANDELAVVRELDVKSLIRHGDRIRAYYGTNDHWCPVEYHTNIVQSVPGLKAELCKKGYAHAFVLKTSEEMAEQVCAWLQEDFSDLFS